MLCLNDMLMNEILTSVCVNTKEKNDMETNASLQYEVSNINLEPKFSLF
jgi:hypothetical protein